MFFYGWGFVVDLAIILVRHFKHWKFYILIHLIIFLILDFSTIIIVSMTLYAKKDSLAGLSDGVLIAHFILGVIFFALVII